MSVVTNVILKTSVFEEKAIAVLNKLGNYNFKSCDDLSLPGGWYGGSKFLECDIYPAAFNFLDVKTLVDDIESVDWRRPKAVQLFVQCQEENQLNEIFLEFESEG